MTGIDFTVTEEMFQQAIKEVVIRQLEASEDFQTWFRDVVRAEVKIQAPGNPRFQRVIQGVRDHLDRYPALADDRGLQDAVGKAVFDYLQKAY